MFPKSNTSQTIYDLFVSESEKLGVNINLKSSVTSLTQEGENKYSSKWTKVTI